MTLMAHLVLRCVWICACFQPGLCLEHHVLATRVWLKRKEREKKRLAAAMHVQSERRGLSNTPCSLRLPSLVSRSACPLLFRYVFNSHWNTLKRIQQVTCPILFLSGQRDELIHPGMSLSHTPHTSHVQRMYVYITMHPARTPIHLSTCVR